MTQPAAKYRPIHPRLLKYEDDIVERFAIMTTDGRLTDPAAAYELRRAGLITQNDMETIANARF